MKPLFVLFICYVACTYSIASKSINIIKRREHDLKAYKHTFGIVNGNDTTISKHPYLGTINVENDIYCVGTILGKRWMVTNAFCFRWVDVTEMTFRVGSTKWNTGGQLVNLTSVFIPDEFENGDDYNVALVKTETAIKFNKKTKPIKMATKEPEDGAAAVIAGWGTTEEGYRGKLKEATVNIVNRTSCQNDYLYPFPTLTERMLCAYREDVAPCNYDEGAPLVYKNKLVGYYIGENSCGVSDAPQVYSNVAKLQKWIKKIMKENS